MAHRWWVRYLGPSGEPVRVLVDVRPEYLSPVSGRWQVSVLAVPVAGGSWHSFIHGSPHAACRLDVLDLVDVVTGLRFGVVNELQADQVESLLDAVKSDRAVTPVLFAAKMSKVAPFLRIGQLAGAVNATSGSLITAAVHGEALRRLNESLPSDSRLATGNVRSLHVGATGLFASTSARITSGNADKAAFLLATCQQVRAAQLEVCLRPACERGLLEEMTLLLHTPPVDAAVEERVLGQDARYAAAGEAFTRAVDLVREESTAGARQEIERLARDNHRVVTQYERERDRVDGLTRQVQVRDETIARLRAELDNLTRRRAFLVRALASTRTRHPGSSSEHFDSVEQMRRQLLRRAEQAEAGRDEAYAAMDTLGAELDDALRRAAHLAARARDDSGTAPVASESQPVFNSWSELLAAGRRLPRLWLAPTLGRTTARLEARPSWLQRTWSTMVALHDYAEAKAAGATGNFHTYLSHPGTPGRRIARSSYSPAEPESVLVNTAWRTERLFPVPETVDASGAVLMVEHVRIGNGPPHPRLYFLDNTCRPGSSEGRILVGYLGGHLRNSLS
ncbi:Phage shock protein A [Actinosynnema pretiosum]|nr:Phage shock protein A [Actinosynnema pretiosum]